MDLQFSINSKLQIQNPKNDLINLKVWMLENFD
jgi:hypothetical protein